MATRCFPLVRGRVMRVTRLDGCGRPVYGDCAQVVTDGFISVALTANLSEGEPINVTNAAGQQCVNVPAVTSLLNYTVVVTFCQVDPELYAMMSGQEVIYDPYTGDAIGFKTDTAVRSDESGFALELWSQVPGQACSDVGQGAFGYLLLPFLQGGVFGDKTIENGAVTFTLSGAQTRDGSGWGTGPYDVMFDVDGNPAPLNEPVGPTEHERVFYTEIAPPEAACGCQPLIAPVMTMETTVTDLTVELDFTGTAPNPDDPDFVIIDWGDQSALQTVPVTGADPVTGDWTLGPVSHVYDEPDTYEVTATYYTVTRRAELAVGVS